MRVLFASTIPETLDVFMRGQLAWIGGQGHDVHVVSSPGPALTALATREGARVHPIPMEREISLVRDAKALVQWMRVPRRIRPDVVVVSTPKAGLLGGLASVALGVPRRVYVLRGARFEGELGVRGILLRGTERVACASAHHVIAVSPSLAKLAIESRVVPAQKLATVGAGSSNGVDLVRFHPPTAAERVEARIRWNLDEHDVALVFVGRMHADKGLDVLRDALDIVVREATSNAVLLLAGADEGANLGRGSDEGIEIRRLGQVADISDLLRAADLLALPTQREGFPNVVLEAAASGLPVVTTDATGAVDSVVDGDTGYVVMKTDGSAFGEALVLLVNDRDLRASQGRAARRRVELEFSNQQVWEGMYREYLGKASEYAHHEGVISHGI